MTTLDKILTSVPLEIVKAVGEEFAELESRFARRDWGPANLNGGRFAEAILRYLEWKQSKGHFTPIGVQLNRTAIFNSIKDDASLPEGIRFQVLKLTDTMLDFRNKRDVAHLGTVVSVDEMDARFIMGCASWIMAEIIREETGSTGLSAQKLIDELSRRRLPLVGEVGGQLIVLSTNLKASTRALVALYTKSPQAIEDARQAVGYENKSRFLDMLDPHIRARLVLIKDGMLYLTPKGVAWLEANVEMELKID